MSILQIWMLHHSAAAELSLNGLYLDMQIEEENTIKFVALLVDGTIAKEAKALLKRSASNLSAD